MCPIYAAISIFLALAIAAPLQVKADDMALLKHKATSNQNVNIIVQLDMQSLANKRQEFDFAGGANLNDVLDAFADGRLTETGAINLNQYISELQKNFVKSMGGSKGKGRLRNLSLHKYSPTLSFSATKKEIASLEKAAGFKRVFEDRIDKLYVQDQNLNDFFGENKKETQETIKQNPTPENSDKPTSPGQYSIVVIDSGVDASHPALGGRVIAEACFTGATKSGRGGCPNGLPFQEGGGAGKPCSGARGCSHGTHVAGIAAGNSNTIKSTSPTANIIAIQAFETYPCEGKICIGAAQSSVLRALTWVVENHKKYKITAVNMSLGGRSFSDYCDEEDARSDVIHALYGLGIPVVIASGNASEIHAIGAPACISYALSVGAVTPDNTVASFSNSAPMLDTLAPGVNIMSSVPGGGYESQSGTSMAAPYVTGLLGNLRARFPQAPTDILYQSVKRAGTVIPDSRNKVKRRKASMASALAYLQKHVPKTVAQPRPTPQNPKQPAKPDTDKHDLSNLKDW